MTHRPGSLCLYDGVSHNHTMTPEQRALAIQLLRSLDDEAIANATVYGDWVEHLSDQVADELTD